MASTFRQGRSQYVATPTSHRPRPLDGQWEERDLRYTRGETWAVSEMLYYILHTAYWHSIYCALHTTPRHSMQYSMQVWQVSCSALHSHMTKQLWRIWRVRLAWFSSRLSPKFTHIYFFFHRLIYFFTILNIFIFYHLTCRTFPLLSLTMRQGGAGEGHCWIKRQLR